MRESDLTLTEILDRAALLRRRAAHATAQAQALEARARDLSSKMPSKVPSKIIFEEGLLSDVTRRALEWQAAALYARGQDDAAAALFPARADADQRAMMMKFARMRGKKLAKRLRNVRIMRLARRGWRNVEIARALGLHPVTVSKLVARLLRGDAGRALE